MRILYIKKTKRKVRQTRKQLINVMCKGKQKVTYIKLYINIFIHVEKRKKCMIIR